MQRTRLRGRVREGHQESERIRRGDGSQKGDDGDFHHFQVTGKHLVPWMGRLAKIHHETGYVFTVGKNLLPNPRR
jgi:hypothetical protein